MCADWAGFPPADRLKDRLAASWEAGARPLLWVLNLVREKMALQKLAFQSISSPPRSKFEHLLVIF